MLDPILAAEDTKVKKLDKALDLPKLSLKWSEITMNQRTSEHMRKLDGKCWENKIGWRECVCQGFTLDYI